MIKIIASIYKHYEKVDLALPPGVDLTPATNGSSQASASTSPPEVASQSSEPLAVPGVGAAGDPIEQESAIIPDEEATPWLLENHGQMDNPPLHFETLSNATDNHCRPTSSVADWWADAPMPAGPTATSVPPEQRDPPGELIPASDIPMPRGPTAASVPEQRPPPTDDPIPPSPVLVPKRKPDPREVMRSRMKNTVGMKRKYP